MHTHEPAITTPHRPRDVHRLDDHPGVTLAGVALAATAIAAAGVFALAISNEMSAAGDPPPVAEPVAATVEDCGRLWDRVRVLGRSDATGEPAATALGLTLRGQWISADGLTWEHLDGRTVVVATPRSAEPTDRIDCATGVDADGRSES